MNRLLSILFLFSQLPLFVVYLRNTWVDRTHYRFLPVLFAALVWLLWREWRQEGPLTRQVSWVARIGLLLGLVMGLAATAFTNAWFAAAAVGVVSFALLSSTKNRSGEFLTGIGALALLGVVLPLDLDWSVIRVLQRASMKLASLFLDMVGILHHANGTTLQLPGGEQYFVEEACSGIQSFFTLVFVALFLGAYYHYRWPRIVGLVALCVPLSLVANAIRISAIPAAEVVAGWDLTEGWPHETLGYLVLAFAIAMLVSANSILGVVLLSIGASLRKVPLVRRLQLLRQRRLRAMAIKAATATATSRTDSVAWRFLQGTATAGMVGLSLVMLLWQANDVRAMFADPEIRVRFFDDLRLAKLDRGDLPTTFGPWRCAAFEYEDRSRGSELGKRSDIWRFSSSSLNSIVSLDQPFPGWHELSTCYQNQGWRLVSREVVTPESGDRWPFVLARFSDDRGEQALLMFSLFDANGKPLEPPLAWQGWEKLWARIQNRLSFRLREQLFQAEAFQVQVFLVSREAGSEATLNAAQEQFFEVRERLRGVVVERLRGD